MSWIPILENLLKNYPSIELMKSEYDFEMYIVSKNPKIKTHITLFGVEDWSLLTVACSNTVISQANVDELIYDLEYNSKWTASFVENINSIIEKGYNVEVNSLFGYGYSRIPVFFDTSRGTLYIESISVMILNILSLGLFSKKSIIRIPGLLN